MYAIFSVLLVTSFSFRNFRSSLGRLLTAGSGWRSLPLDEVRAPGKEFATSLGRALAGTVMHLLFVVVVVVFSLLLGKVDGGDIVAVFLVGRLSVLLSVVAVRMLRWCCGFYICHARGAALAFAFALMVRTVYSVSPLSSTQ